MESTTESRAEETRQTTTWTDLNGIVYTADALTGEVLSCDKPRFAVDSADAAEWVMRQLFDTECELVAAIERERALAENIRRLKSRIESRKNALLWRFSPELEHYAASELANSRERSIVTPFGSFGFRKSREQREIVDEDAAIAFAEANAPEAVKVTKKVLVSKLPPGAEGVVTRPPEDKFFVRSGVKTNGGGE